MARLPPARAIGADPVTGFGREPDGRVAQRRHEQRGASVRTQRGRRPSAALRFLQGLIASGCACRPSSRRPWSTTTSLVGAVHGRRGLRERQHRVRHCVGHLRQHRVVDVVRMAVDAVGVAGNRPQGSATGRPANTPVRRRRVPRCWSGTPTIWSPPATRTSGSEGGRAQQCARPTRQHQARRTGVR